jgi:hypothetical protein
MKQLSVKSTKVLSKLVKMAEDGYFEIDHLEESSLWVAVEVVFDDTKFKKIRLIQYHLEDGDPVPDDEAFFLFEKGIGMYYPIYCTAWCWGEYVESVKIIDDKIVCSHTAVQKMQTIYTDEWLLNLQEQVNSKH